MKQPWNWSTADLRRFLYAHGQIDVAGYPLSKWSKDELVGAVVERQREVAVAAAELRTSITSTRAVMDAARGAMIEAGLLTEEGKVPR